MCSAVFLCALSCGRLFQRDVFAAGRVVLPQRAGVLVDEQRDDARGGVGVAAARRRVVFQHFDAVVGVIGSVHQERQAFLRQGGQLVFLDGGAGQVDGLGLFGFADGGRAGGRCISGVG